MKRSRELRTSPFSMTLNREGVDVTLLEACFVLILPTTSNFANFKHDFPSYGRDPPPPPAQNPLNKSGFYSTVFRKSIEDGDFL